MKPAKLADYLNDQNDSVLLAWDAPLTRPRDPDKPVVNEQDLTIRTIEKFFRRGGLLKPPEGNAHSWLWKLPQLAVTSYSFHLQRSHWHGASPTTAMSHIAIQEKQNGSSVTWLEHVTDEQYRNSGRLMNVRPQRHDTILRSHFKLRRGCERSVPFFASAPATCSWRVKI